MCRKNFKIVQKMIETANSLLWKILPLGKHFSRYSDLYCEFRGFNFPCFFSKLSSHECDRNPRHQLIGLPFSAVSAILNISARPTQAQAMVLAFNHLFWRFSTETLMPARCQPTLAFPDFSRWQIFITEAATSAVIHLWKFSMHLLIDFSEIHMIIKK